MYDIFRERTTSDEQLTNGELIRRVASKKNMWNEKYHNPHHNPQQSHENGRTFLSYNCPMFGYKELVFPILFEEDVIAVFFVGQIKLDGDAEIIQKSKRIFLSQNRDIFIQYLSDTRKLPDAMRNPTKYTIDSINR